MICFMSTIDGAREMAPAESRQSERECVWGVSSTQMDADDEWHPPS